MTGRPFATGLLRGKSQKHNPERFIFVSNDLQQVDNVIFHHYIHEKKDREPVY
jgi:hypothetical protein